MSYQDPTPNPKTHTPHRPLRIPEEEWEPMGNLVGPRGRTRVIREFIRWYIGHPGAKLPQRPNKQPNTPP